jgi:hypothetical protein
MPRRAAHAVHEIDLFAAKEFSPKQAELIEWYREQRSLRFAGLPHQTTLAACWGRRCGKSDGISALFAETVADLLGDAADAIASGAADPWRGIGKPRSEARLARPHVLAFVIAPSGRDLRDIAGHLLNIFSGEAECFLHSDPKMRFGSANGLSMYLVLEGAAARIDFIPAKAASAMVGRGVAAALITESGFVPSEHWDKLSPSFWDSGAWVYCEGTPKQDPSHWFTQLVVSGLDDEDPEANRDTAARNPAVFTSRANTIEHAFLRSVREKAAIEAQYRGKKWADLWIYAKVTAPAETVFDEFDPVRGVVEVEAGGNVKIRRTIDGETTTLTLPYPNHVEGYIDWSQGASPNALTICYVWTHRPRPIDASDPRPLVLQVHEFMDDDERLQPNKDGLWAVFKQAKLAWGVQRFFADPSSPNLIGGARRHGTYISEADNLDKSGRILLLNALLNVGPAGWPAMLISSTCRKTINALSSVGWKKDQEGRPTDIPQKYNLHLPDTLCYMSGRWGRGYSFAPTQTPASARREPLRLVAAAGGPNVVNGEVP